MDRGGEDSADATDSMMIVADGVSAWSLMGHDPGLFSKKLTADAIEDSQKNRNKSPVNIILDACRTAAVDNVGSATVSAIKVRNQKYLSLANLGDSGVAIFRPVAGDRLEFVFETEPTQHMFNSPF